MNTSKIIALISFMLALAIGLFLFRGKQVEPKTPEIVSLERVVQMREAGDFAGGTSESEIPVSAVPTIAPELSNSFEMEYRKYDKEYLRIDIAYGPFFAAVGEGLSEIEIEEIKFLLVENNLDKLGMYSMEVGMSDDELVEYHKEINQFDQESEREIQSLMSEDVAERFHNHRQSMPYRSYIDSISKQMSSNGIRLEGDLFENMLYAYGDFKKEYREYLKVGPSRNLTPGSVSKEEDARIWKQIQGEKNAILVNRLSRVLEPEGVDLFLEIYYSNSALPLMSE